MWHLNIITFSLCCQFFNKILVLCKIDPLVLPFCLSIIINTITTLKHLWAIFDGYYYRLGLISLLWCPCICCQVEWQAKHFYILRVYLVGRGQGLTLKENIIGILWPQDECLEFDVLWSSRYITGNKVMMGLYCDFQNTKWCSPLTLLPPPWCMRVNVKIFLHTCN